MSQIKGAHETSVEFWKRSERLASGESRVEHKKEGLKISSKVPSKETEKVKSKKKHSDHRPPQMCKTCKH